LFHLFPCVLSAMHGITTSPIPHPPSPYIMVLVNFTAKVTFHNIFAYLFTCNCRWSCVLCIHVIVICSNLKPFVSNYWMCTLWCHFSAAGLKVCDWVFLKYLLFVRLYLIYVFMKINKLMNLFLYDICEFVKIRSVTLSTKKPIKCLVI